MFAVLDINWLLNSDKTPRQNDQIKWLPLYMVYHLKDGKFS
jgi:hypothetical protein